MKYFKYKLKINMKSHILKRKLLISLFIRIILTLLILFFFNIPLYCKILFIILTDFIDCDIPRLLFGFNNWINCRTEFYQKTDKITDIICYFILLCYIIKYYNSNYIFTIIILFIFRLIGTILFIIKNDRKYLFYFPNFFLEITFGIILIKDIPEFNNYKWIIIINIIIYKILMEYYLHIYKPSQDKYYLK